MKGSRTTRRALSGASFIAATLCAAAPGWAQTAPASSAEPSDPAAAEEVADIIVTGSSIRGVPPTGSNLISVSRQDIEAIGATTTPDILAAVPQLNSFNTAPRAANGGAGAFAPGLRGLPASATLPLMNGHRLISGGNNETNPDYPFIPELAIERVEIVADGASSIYGSDAVAGVINFITRTRFSGFETSVRYGVADDYDALSASAIFGHAWNSGSVVIAYQYSENGNITGGDRDFRVLDFRPFGGVDTRATSCPLANVRVDATAFAVYYAAPGLAPNTRNYCDNGAVADLVPRSRLHSAYLSARQELGDDITVWGEILYSDRRDTVRGAPPVQGVFISRTNPFFQAPPSAPGATTAFVEFRPDNLFGADHVDNVYRVEAGNASVGIDAGLFGDLRLSVYGTYDWASNDATLPGVNPAALAAAAAGTTPATALDPFGNRTSPTVAANITNFPIAVISRQDLIMGAAKIDGSLLDLPGGALRIALGAEYREERREQSGLVGATPVPENQSRDIRSVYGELFLPIFGPGNETTLLHRLDVSVSARFDEYSDFGSTTNPKVGVNWAPVDGMTFRGTYGTSFRAPGLRDLAATVGAYYYSAADAAVLLRDPSRGAAQVNTVYLLGGNRDLQPEEARTFSIGVDLRPPPLPGFHASATFYDIRYTNVIATPSNALVFTDPTFLSVVFRNPTQAQLNSLLAIAVPVNLPTPLPAIGNALDLRRGNFGVRDTNGVDFDIGYRLPTRFGAAFAGLAGNYIFKFDTQLSPTAPVSNQLNLGLPELTLRGTLGAQIDALTLVAFVNYRGGVTGLYTTPTGTASFSADPYTTVDLRITWRLPNLGVGERTELALQVNDLFDATPPFFPATDGIGGPYNPIGRFVAVNLRTSF